MRVCSRRCCNIQRFLGELGFKIEEPSIIDQGNKPATTMITNTNTTYDKTVYQTTLRLNEIHTIQASSAFSLTEVLLAMKKKRKIIGIQIKAIADQMRQSIS